MNETLALFASDNLERRQQAARARQVRQARRSIRGNRRLARPAGAPATRT